MKNKVTALLLATTMAISGTAGAFTVSAAEAADSGTLKLSVTTGDGSTSDDKIPTPWYNRLLATNLMFRSLFLADSNLTNAQPDLADSYEISDDKLTYTMRSSRFVKKEFRSISKTQTDRKTRVLLLLRVHARNRNLQSQVLQVRRDSVLSILRNP